MSKMARVLYETGTATHVLYVLYAKIKTNSSFLRQR
jgi:hypothetical protein